MIINEQIQNNIKHELSYLGYNPNNYGTLYIMEAIYILYININNNNFNCNLIRNVYPIIAKKYNKTIINIQSNITNATNSMVCECEEEKLLKYLGYYSFSKPGSKRIIETVLTKLQRKYGRC